LALGADELRDLVRDILPELDHRAHGRVVNRLIDRAARIASGWVPPPPSGKGVSEVVSFAEAAKRVGSSDPLEVDGYLRHGSSAFLGKDYAAAFTIFHALLLPIGDGRIDLGQHELLDEVLSVDAADCAAQYVVSMYMTAVPGRRAEAVRSAMNEVCGIGNFREPLREMERVAIEPLPQLDDFLPRWRALIEEDAGRERRGDWDTDEDNWLREVVRRTEGAKGLRRVARSTRRAEDLQAWCRMLVEAREWKEALSAYEEAAEIVSDEVYWRGVFLDGAALAARELGGRDLPVRLGRAWREAPSMPRLRRWLGSAESRVAVRKRAAEALEICPKQAHRQQAILSVLLGRFGSAAKLLAAAPSMGWSDSEHPGPLLFPTFSGLLGRGDSSPWADAASSLDLWAEPDELEWETAGRGEPRLDTPGVDAVLELAGAGGPVRVEERMMVLRAMRKATDRVADLQDRIRVAEQRSTQVREELIALERDLVDENETARALAVFDPVWETLAPREQARVIRLLVQRVDYDGEKGTVSVSFHPAGIKILSREFAEATR
jgi:hypothetical protein